MKKASLLFGAVAGLVLLALASPALAADEGKDAKERTITGEAKCAKCALKEADKCQTVVEVEAKNGRKQAFYLEDNDVAKKFHKEVCQETKKVTVTGTNKRVDNKNHFTATKIELVKDKDKEKTS